MASAQDDRIGITFGVQAGYEYLHYIEYIRTSQSEGEYEGASTALVATGSIEFDLQHMFDLPFFVAVSGGIPLTTFGDEDTFVEQKAGNSFLTQTNKVEHEYSMLRAFAGYKFKPEFQPFLLFERALFQSTRWDRREGTDDGILILDSPNVTWRERVWSSHIGGGFQGGIPFGRGSAFSTRFRFGVLFPISSFVTNDHPVVNTTDGSFGTNADGMSILSRIAVHYNWHERSSLQLGINWYYRKWQTVSRISDGKVLTWPENDMDAIPVLLGFTWSI